MDEDMTPPVTHCHDIPTHVQISTMKPVKHITSALQPASIVGPQPGFPPRSAVRRTLLAALVTGASPFAFGGPGHEKKAGPVKKEQKEWGIAGDAKAVKRTIEVSMSDDMRFTPARMEIKADETLKFILRNNGKVLHEFVLGTKKTLDEHAALMVKFPGMVHEEPYMAHVPPGKSDEMIWKFNKPGNFDFACLIAGHYQAGMVGKITVAAK
jgi:uncharacterized cupredoxin-like copper-binding protein